MEEVRESTDRVCDPFTEVGDPLERVHGEVGKKRKKRAANAALVAQQTTPGASDAAPPPPSPSGGAPNAANGNGTTR